MKEYINGKLEGMWRVDKITKSDGTVIDIENSQDYNNPYNKHIYISFQFHVVQLSGYDGHIYFGNLQYDGNTVKLDFPRNINNITPLNQWGIYSTEVTYKIDTLTRDHLVMTSPESTMECTHF